jgi:hypothetical protein
MPYLSMIDIGHNNLTCLPYNAFNNLLHLDVLRFDSNNLSTIELWMFQGKKIIGYHSNPIERFSNNFNVDLSNLPNRPLTLGHLPFYPNINFDDTVFEMYNRCVEIHNIPNFNKTYTASLTLVILSITGYLMPIFSGCTCDKYYFYRAAFAAKIYLNDNFFFKWICFGDKLPFAQKCNYQSSANFENVIPRLCKINDSELGKVPVYVESSLCGMVMNMFILQFTMTSIYLVGTDYNYYDGYNRNEYSNYDEYNRIGYNDYNRTFYNNHIVNYYSNNDKYDNEFSTYSSNS